MYNKRTLKQIYEVQLMIHNDPEKLKKYILERQPNGRDNTVSKQRSADIPV
jgi:hypothetical protein